MVYSVLWIAILLALAIADRLSHAWVAVPSYSTRPEARVVRSTIQWASRSKDYPPDFTVIETDEEDGDYDASRGSSVSAPPDFTILADDETSSDMEDLEAPRPKKSPAPRTRERTRRAIPASSGVRGVSWMQRNTDFVNVAPAEEERSPQHKQAQPRKRLDGPPYNNERRRDGDSRTFRQDFRGSRVFVQGIPPTASWQDLKDHFRVAGNVVYSSISQDPRTGESKGHGFVQFETTEMALTAIAIMRDHPMDGHTLFVREDLKDEQEGASLGPRRRRGGDSQLWECANEINAEYLSETDRTEVESLIRARDDARKRRNYKVSDSIREELKFKFGIHIDDRLKMWWTSMDGKTVPEVIQNIKGDGKWSVGGLAPWRQIPTTPENDACVNPDLVEGLLKQRDIARREKDFATADSLLEQARTAPDGDLSLRIHDESRTWRIWTDAPPPRPLATHLSPEEQCIAIVQEHAPSKIHEIKLMLERFPGREYKILKKLKSAIPKLLN